MTAEPLDLGHGVTVRITRDAASGEPVGLIQHHTTPDGKGCGGHLTFAGHGDPDEPTWTVNSLEPLDLAPSLSCGRCGHHGWIRSGRWVPA